MALSACRVLLFGCLATALLTGGVEAASLLSQNDFIISIDVDPPASDSGYTLGEGPLSAIDGSIGTKYFNSAAPPKQVGLIVEPFINLNTTVRSIQFTTANDATQRDPAGWELYGTNDAISSSDNGTGMAENWSLIASSALELPLDRQTAGPIQNFANSTAYDSYRILVTGVRTATSTNGMQFSEVQLFTGTDGTGTPVFTAADNALAFHFPQSDSNYAANEPPSYLIDLGGPTSSYRGDPVQAPINILDGANGTRYFNDGSENSGFIVTPSAAAQVQSFTLTKWTTATNLAQSRAPSSYVLFGTNDPILSTDNSFGTAESWTQIASGALAVPGPGQDYPTVSFSNPTSYSSYKMLFPTIGTPGINGGLPLTPGMILAEASFFTSSDGTGTDILQVGTPSILAVDPDPAGPTANRHNNNGGANSGFIVTPAAGATIVDSFQVATGHNFSDRDPTSWELYGTNDAVTSDDNSQGNEENWTLISSGTFTEEQMPLTRLAQGTAVSFANATQYTSYRMVFPTLRNEETAAGMLLSDIQFFGTVLAAPSSPGDFNDDGIVNAADYTLWRNNLGAGNESAINGNGDGGDISISDYNLWKMHYGDSYPGAGGLSAGGTNVPEPATVALLAFGLALPVWRSRKRSTAG